MNLECGFSLHPPSPVQLTPSHFHICNLQHQSRGILGAELPCLEMPAQVGSTPALFTELGCDFHLSCSKAHPHHHHRVAMALHVLLPFLKGTEAC